MKQLPDALIDTLDDLEHTYERHLELTYAGQITTLYRFYDRAEQLLYVGITATPPKRFAKHQADKEWWHAIVNIKLEHFPTRQEALDAERAAIISERPLYNIQHNAAGWQPYREGRTPDLSPVVAKRAGDCKGLCILVDRYSDDQVAFGRGEHGEAWAVLSTDDEYFQVNSNVAGVTRVLWYGPVESTLEVGFPNGTVATIDNPSPVRPRKQREAS